jgi:MipA family protein
MRIANIRHRIALAAATTLIGGASGLRPACADPKPLWEFGLGVGAVTFADYRGSDTSHVYPVPVPYFVYRGKFLRADRNGLRGLLFNQDRVELSISTAATTPVRNSSARSGMPELRPTVEIGPSIDVHVWRSTDERVKFDVHLPARAVFTIESSPRSIGWFSSPNLNVDITNIGGPRGWNLGVLAGPLFADRRYDDYYYTVAPEFATANRHAYRAHGGYSGTQMLASLSKRYPSYWTGAYVRYDTLSGASFESSPLVKRTGYWSAGVGIAWMIGQSSRLVEAED